MRQEEDWILFYNTLLIVFFANSPIYSGGDAGPGSPIQVKNASIKPFSNSPSFLGQESWNWKDDLFTSLSTIK